MSQDATWSRRGLIAVTLSTLGLSAKPGVAQEAEARDRGLGGTGVAPDELGTGDRGIGGTGVVGTIRRFGSIVVNDLRITFPPDVAVRIDGEPAAVGDLRLGHVVHVLARHVAGSLVTAAIAADSEVVGPIEVMTPDGMIVLGQSIAYGQQRPSTPWRLGQWVAVSGLRRLDGAIAASRIARSRKRTARVAGRPRPDGSGSIGIGALLIDGLPPEAVERRVLVAGDIVRGRLVARNVDSPWSDLLAARPDHLSLEDYVALDGSDIHFASGLPTVTSPAGGQATAETRAIISAAVTPAGHIEVEGIRIEGRHGGMVSGRGERPGAVRAGPPGFSPNGPGGTGPEFHGPGGFNPGQPGGSRGPGVPGRAGAPGGPGGHAGGGGGGGRQ